MRRKLPEDSCYGEPGRPPFEVSGEGRWWVEEGVFVAIEFGLEVRKQRQTGVTLRVDKGDVAKGAMEFFNIAQGTTPPSELGNEGIDTVQELEAFMLRQGDVALLEVPKKTNEDKGGSKCGCSLVGMPRDLQGGNGGNHVCLIICVSVWSV